MNFQLVSRCTQLPISKRRLIHRQSNQRNLAIKTHRITDTVRASSVRVKSLASDCQLYAMSYQDILTWSMYHNFVMFQLPCIFMYRMMKYNETQIVYYLLVNGVIKTIVQMIILQTTR
jgi:hypothetical protein